MSDSPVVLVTGCSMGIGKATAARLKAAGWNVWATARNEGALAELAAAGCDTLPLDVTDEASVQAAVGRIGSEEGGIDALVNNAGYGLSGTLETSPLDAVRAQFETNVFGLLRLCQLVLPGMRQRRRGRIVNVSSMGGVLTFPGGGAYHATKYAVESLSDALRFEVRGFGIDVIVFQPRLIRTQFADTAVGAIPADRSGPYSAFNEAVARATQSIYVSGPLARLGGGPDVVARTIERALAARRPRTRYAVTPSARLLMGLRRLTSDRLWDRFVGASFPTSGAP